MNTQPQASIRRPRLNPFAFPSDTDFRFALLIIFVLGGSPFMYIGLHFVFYDAGTVETTSACMKEALKLPDLTNFPNANTSLDAKALGRCLDPFIRGVAIWMISGVALLVVIAGLIYWIHPVWKIWRQRLLPLSREDAPELVVYLSDLRQETGLSHCPVFVWSPLNSASNALAFGHFGRYYVALTGGLVTQFYTDLPAFRAIVLHELAHLRNADVDKTYFAVAIWWAFVIAPLIPYSVGLFFRENVGWGDIFSITWRALALSVLVYLTRNAVLRARELYADVRASTWDGPSGHLLVCWRHSQNSGEATGEPCGWFTLTRLSAVEHSTIPLRYFG